MKKLIQNLEISMTRLEAKLYDSDNFLIPATIAIAFMVAVSVQLFIKG